MILPRIEIEHSMYLPKILLYIYVELDAITMLVHMLGNLESTSQLLQERIQHQAVQNVTRTTDSEL